MSGIMMWKMTISTLVLQVKTPQYVPFWIYHKDSSAQLITPNRVRSSIFWLGCKIFSLQNWENLKSSVFTFNILSVVQSSVFTKANLQTSWNPGCLLAPSHHDTYSLQYNCFNKHEFSWICINKCIVYNYSYISSVLYLSWGLSQHTMYT